MINQMYQRIKAALRLIRNARVMYEALREIKAYDRDQVTIPERVAEGSDYNEIAFTEEERAAAGFIKPSRFDPNSVWLYTKDAHHLISQPDSTRRLTKRMMIRILFAVAKRRPTVRRYRLCE